MWLMALLFDPPRRAPHLLLLVDILVNYSEMPLLNVVGDVNYVLLVQIYCITVTIYNGIEWT